MPTAAIYCRQSFYKEDSCSIDMQIERSKAFCISQGWDYIVYDIDKGYSGKDTDRPGFRQMMKDITAGNINYVVVYKLDRISRNLKDFFGLMEEFKSREVGFRSLTENFDTTTPMGRAMLAIIAVFAQLERETTAERVRDNMLDRFRLGIWNGGPIPFGFLGDKTTILVNGKEKAVSVLVQDETEAEYIKQFYGWYLEPQGSYLSNTKKANGLGIPTKSGKAWNPNQMQRIMKNPLYCVADQAAYEYFSTLGIEMACDQSDFDGVHGLMWYNRRKPHKKTTRLKDQSEWVVAVGGHPGIIPGKLFVKAQKKIVATTFAPARTGTGSKGLLASLIKCGKCGKAMVYADYNHGTWQYYKCRSKEQQGSCVCSGQTVKGNELDQAVVTAIKQICADRAFLEDIARQAIKNTADNTKPLLEDKHHLSGKLDALSAEQKELVRALGKKTMPVELIEERIQEIEREKAPILKQMEEIDSKLDTQDWQKIDMEMVFGNLLRFNEVFDEMEFEEKRIFLRSIVKEIIYDKGKIKLLLYFLPEITSVNPSGSNNNSGTSIMNPCLCGNFGSDIECRCTPLQIHKYMGRISGPLLDRMDLHVEVPRIRYEELKDTTRVETSKVIRARVTQAREIQQSRFANKKISLNSQMTPSNVKTYCCLDKESEQMLKHAFNKFNMSARAHDRILKVARTIADLEASEDIKVHHLAEAIQYRSLDRKYWRNL